MNFWKGKKVFITGGTGFIGSHLADFLVGNGAIVSVTTTSKKDPKVRRNLSESIKKVRVIEADLRDKRAAAKAMKGNEILFQLAAIVGGVQFNLDHPATMLRDNSAITSNVLEAARINGIERSVIVSSSTVYPDSATGALKEEIGFIGEPDMAKFGYGWSKRFDEVLARAYATEFGLKIGIARPFNVYGPREVSDPKKSHVIPSLIQQIRQKNHISIFGNGEQQRSFVFVKDIAVGLAKMCELHPKPDPINLGAADGIRIIDLARKISAIMGKKVEITTDGKSDSGSARRVCDVTKAEKLLGFKAQTSIDEGLRQTIAWLEENSD